MYGQTVGNDLAREFAAYLTLGALADQTPAVDLWQSAHRALLEAVRNHDPVDWKMFQSSATQYLDITPLVDFDDVGNNHEWEWEAGMTVRWVDSPWVDSGEALLVEFVGEFPYVSYWMDESDWREWDILLVDIYSQSPYFTELDVAIGDDEGNYLLLRNGAILIGPLHKTTIALPLLVPFGVNETMNWDAITYMELEVNTTIERTDGFGDDHVYDIGARKLIFDNFRLARRNE
jgi:hypothetical protein